MNGILTHPSARIALSCGCFLLTTCYHPPHKRTPEWDQKIGKPRPDRLSAHQIPANDIPASPDSFSPDPGGNDPRYFTQPEPELPDLEITKTTTTSVDVPLAPAQFNPDPGGLPIEPDRLPEGKNTPSESRPGPFFKGGSSGIGDRRFFMKDPGASSLNDEESFTPVIPDYLQLPRGPVTHSQLDAKLPEGFDDADLFEPATPGAMVLPRKGVRYEERIYEHWHAGHHDHIKDPPNMSSVEDRFRVPPGQWDRYLQKDLAETPYEENTPYLWHPYYQSVLKGDLPIFGQDIFASITVQNITDIEVREIPLPSGVSTARPFSSEFFGDNQTTVINSNTAVTFDLFRGETSFKPVEWLFRAQPVFNTNYVSFNETTLVSPDPRGLSRGTSSNPFSGSPGGINPGDIDSFLDPLLNTAGSDLSNSRAAERLTTQVAFQQLFLETHLLDLTENYDFATFRFGTQIFNADFRGHVFSDANWGYRMFGNLAKNRIQYNLAFFDLFEKESFSELNTFDDRNQNVFVANIYLQDYLFEGYTSQFVFLANWDKGSKSGLVYDSAGAIVRPSPIGSVAPHDLEAYYLGWNGEGHIGRLNISHSLYHVFGKDDLNGLAGQSVDISAWMAALELSVDTDWMRHKFTMFYASGDSDASDSKATGWDAIVDNPNFLGGPFSYWQRQGLNLGGTAVSLKQRLSLIPELGSNKFLGQSNFVNPGVFIIGLGEEWELTPRTRFFANLNYLTFVNTDSISAALVTDGIAKEIGLDLSFGVETRPLLTDNIRISAGLGMLFPGEGFKDIYRSSSPGVPGFTPTSSDELDDVLFSGFLTLNMTF